jgi:hypothetical protein
LASCQAEDGRWWHVRGALARFSFLESEFPRNWKLLGLEAKNRGKEAHWCFRLAFKYWIISMPCTRHFRTKRSC